jgi:hypothetical protein
LSDGQHSLLDIAERSRVAFPMIRDAADLLHENGLLSVVSEDVAKEKSSREATPNAAVARRGQS